MDPGKHPTVSHLRAPPQWPLAPAQCAASHAASQSCKAGGIPTSQVRRLRLETLSSLLQIYVAPDSNPRLGPSPLCTLSALLRAHRQVERREGLHQRGEDGGLHRAQKDRNIMSERHRGVAALGTAHTFDWNGALEKDSLKAVWSRWKGF